MNFEKAEKIITAACGLEWQEWERIAEMVERKFARAKAQAKYSQQDAEHAVIALKAEAPRG